MIMAICVTCQEKFDFCDRMNNWGMKATYYRATWTSERVRLMAPKATGFNLIDRDSI